MLGTLFIVATPIGNLEDVTSRALRTLGEVSAVLAEDTRVAKKLLSHFNISTPVERFDMHASDALIAAVAERLGRGEDLALVTDAGTPAISDPGSWLVSEAVRILGGELKVVPISGASAVTSALSVSGFHSDVFTFYGFAPHKKGRAARLREIGETTHTAVFFESPHRIEKTLNDLSVICPERRVVVCRELTKMFETVQRGTVKELAEAGVVRAQGEFVVVLGPKN